MNTLTEPLDAAVTDAPAATAAASGAAPASATAPASGTALEAEVAALIVASLHLEIGAGEIEPEAPLFGEGLGLDSIDALELALAISREYGLELKSDEDRNRAIFASLRALAAHIGAHRTLPPGVT